MALDYDSFYYFEDDAPIHPGYRKKVERLFLAFGWTVSGFIAVVSAFVWVTSWLNFNAQAGEAARASIPGWFIPAAIIAVVSYIAFRIKKSRHKTNDEVDWDWSNAMDAYLEKNGWRVTSNFVNLPSTVAETPIQHKDGRKAVIKLERATGRPTIQHKRG